MGRGTITSYKNDFYMQLHEHKYANWVECFEMTAKHRLKVAEIYRTNYTTYKRLLAKYRFNAKHVKALKNMMLEAGYGKLNKKEECKK